jgi:hypothetical protein
MSMNIILGSENIKELSDRFTVLELDSFRVNGNNESTTAYCVLENIGIPDLMNLENLKSLHGNLIKNYKLRNWNFCEQAIDHLMGKWNGQVDTFYQSLIVRISNLKNQTIDDSWDGAIIKEQ